MGANCALICERGIYDLYEDEQSQGHVGISGLHCPAPFARACDSTAASTLPSISVKGVSDPHIPSLWTPLYGPKTRGNMLSPRQTARFAEVMISPQGTLGEEFRTPRPSARQSPRPPDEGMQEAMEEISYEGERLDDMKHGVGRLRMVGMTYVGEFCNDMRHGEGMMVWEDGRQFLGQFQNNDFHGHGTMLWPDGRQYCGQYMEGRKHGEGILSWADDRRYSGQWVAGKRQGVGVYTNAKCITRTAMWQNDQPVRWETPEAPIPLHTRAGISSDEVVLGIHGPTPEDSDVLEQSFDV